jgi:ribokinase
MRPDEKSGLGLCVERPLVCYNVADTSSQKRSNMKKIVVIGSTNTDMVITGKRIPVPGETVSGGRFMMTPGGKGANQAVAVARLSAKRRACTFIAKVGDDLFGRDTALRMKKDGIAAHLVVDKTEPSGTALILVDAKGQNVISVALGANGTLLQKDVAPFTKEIENAAALLMQLETPVETVAWAAKVAHDAGVTVVLNPAPARKLPKAIYPLIDWITPNETEAEILTGVKVVDAKSAAKAAAVLKKRGVGHVVITLGSKGAYCGDCDKIYPCRKVKAVDCVAAGDTFNGALVVALAEGMGCAEAIEFAQKASSIAVTRPGAQSSIPYRKEL